MSLKQQTIVTLKCRQKASVTIQTSCWIYAQKCHKNYFNFTESMWLLRSRCSASEDGWCVHLVYVFQESNTHRTPKQKLCRLHGSAEWCKSFLAMKIRKHRHHSQIQYWIMNIVILYNLKTWLQQETSREPLRHVNASLTVSLGIFFQVSIFGITADVRAQS